MPNMSANNIIYIYMCFIYRSLHKPEISHRVVGNVLECNPQVPPFDTVGRGSYPSFGVRQVVQ